MKYANRIFYAIAIALTISAPAMAADVEGSEDHPLITRYPGSEIRWYHVENYMPFKFPVGPITGYRHIEESVETEGRVTRIYYVLEGGQRSHSEVYKNYEEAIKAAGLEVLAEGLLTESSRKPDIGSRAWQDIYIRMNPFSKPGDVNAMAAGSASSGGSGTIIAKKERAEGTIYVAVSVYHFSDNNISTLVDIVEVESAETGLIAVDAEAIGKGITENGRVVLDGIYFDFDKATITPESAPTLEQIAIYLNDNADKNFYVVGHTDAKGTFAYNEKLSADRAAAVVAALTKDHGIAGERLEAHGVGPLVPVFTNASEAGRERNRRVELVER